LLNDELARGVRSESVLAICYWWGVNDHVVWNWRRALGVGTLNEGSARLRSALNAEIGARQRGRKLPPDQVERRRQTALALGLKPRWDLRDDLWTPQELALLGTARDADVAARIGRTPKAVRLKREKLGIPTARGRRRA
jgi:hypothetical protein